MIRIWLFAVAILLQASVGYADMSFINEYTSSARGQTGQPYIMTTYFTPDKMKVTDSRGSDVIIDLNRKWRISINNKAERFGIQALWDWADSQKNLPFDFGQFELTITATGDTEIVNGHKCTRIEIKMGGIKRTSWVSKDIKPDTAVLEFYKRYGEMFKDVPLIASEKEIWERYAKMEAFPVKIVDRLDPPYASTITTIYKSHNYNKIDPALFEIPDGYIGRYKLTDLPDTASQESKNQKKVMPGSAPKPVDKTDK